VTHSIADFSLACTATALYLYPIKACAAMPVAELALDARGGAVGDRGWAIVNARGEVTWQGEFPRLALVRPRLEGARLHLGAQAVDDVTTSAELVACQVKIWSDLAARHDVFDAADAGDAVADWLAQVVGAPVRLVRLGEAAVAQEGNNALHLVFAPSMQAVDAQLAATGRPGADPRRYRPNIVLSGPPGEDGVEFIEESLAALDWPQARLEITAPCVRCPVPNVDPDSGRVDETVGHTLTRMSRQRRGDGGTVFGVYARGPAGARLRVGDSARMVLAF
jgi:uncharacterized protein YcbX